MRLIQVALRSLNGNFSHQRRHLRSFFTDTPGSGNGSKNNESIDDFEHRIFDGFSGNTQGHASFFQKLDNLEKGRARPGIGPNMYEDGLEDDDLDRSFSTLSDGMEARLEEAARYFEFDPEEIEQEDYSFRPDVNFQSPGTYDLRDLDLTKPGIQKPFQRPEWDTTTEEVLRKADFRNVRFLANFITDSGIIIKRSHTKISAKAQRKVAREIKTARAFGLMPFTTMGQDRFVFGKSRANFLDDDDDIENYDHYDHEEYGDEFVDPVDPIDPVDPVIP